MYTIITEHCFIDAESKKLIELGPMEFSRYWIVS